MFQRFQPLILLYTLFFAVPALALPHGASGGFGAAAAGAEVFDGVQSLPAAGVVGLAALAAAIAVAGALVLFRKPRK